MAGIALLLPTRQRPELLARFIYSALATADKPKDVIISAYIDQDDDSYDGWGFPSTVISRGPRIVLSQMWNVAYEAVKDQADYFGHMGDDIVFKTKGWDTQVKQAIDSFPKQIAFVWGDDTNDQSQRNEFGTHGFIHKNWCEVTGRFVPPYFVSDYNDTNFNDIAKELGVRKYLDNVITEHMHVSLGKMKMDQNTVDRLVRHEKERPDEIYHSRWFRIEQKDEIEKLRQYIDA